MSTSLPTFGVTVEDLRGLMELRGEEGRDKLQEFGGVDIMCKKLASSPVTGLTSTKSVIDHHRFIFGSNLIPAKSPKTFLQLMCAALHDVKFTTLLISAIVSFILWAVIHHVNKDGSDEDLGEIDDSEGWIDDVAILLAISMGVIAIALNGYLNELEFWVIQKEIEGDHTFSVIRDGLVVQVQIEAIVVGDICQIKSGDLLPADGIVIRGTHVTDGSGKFLVTAVGIESGVIFGLVKASVDSPEEVANATPAGG